MLHGSHFCFYNMKMSNLISGMSVTKKCCFCLCMFCSLASVAGPPVSMYCSSDKVGGWELSQVLVLFHQQKSGKFPGSHRWPCLYTVITRATSLPNYTNLHQHAQEQVLWSEILGEIRVEVKDKKKRSTLWGGEANKEPERQRACLDMSHWSEWKKSWPDSLGTQSNYPFQKFGCELTGVKAKVCSD